MPDNQDKKIATLHQASYTDETDRQAGRITDAQYWARVHARDAQVRAMAPADRKRVNVPYGPGCGCSFCRTLRK